jgi:hypothetical protein
MLLALLPLVSRFHRLLGEMFRRKWRTLRVSETLWNVQHHGRGAKLQGGPQPKPLEKAAFR